MTTHILNFGYTTDQTLAAELFAIGSDTVAATASSVTEATNRKGRYAATFSDVEAGDYLLIYFLSGTAAGSEYFTVAGTDGESLLPWSEQGPSQQAAAVLAAAAATPIHADMRLINGKPLQPLGYDPAREETLQEVLGAVGTMSAEAVRVPSPNVRGNLNLVSGDTYDGIANAKPSWIVAADYTDGWSVALTIRSKNDEVVLTATGEVESAALVSVGLVGPAGLAFEGCPGVWQGKYDVQLSKGESRKTIALGKCYVSEDQTR